MFKLTKNDLKNISAGKNLPVALGVAVEIYIRGTIITGKERTNLIDATHAYGDLGRNLSRTVFDMTHPNL